MLGDDGKPVLPGAFIPAAERYGHMSSIDHWVVRNMLAWMGATSTQDSAFSINLSGASVGSSGLLNDIKQGFRSYRVNPRRVCFEITETAAIAEFVESEAIFDRLREIGVDLCQGYHFGTPHATARGAPQCRPLAALSGAFRHLRFHLKLNPQPLSSVLEMYAIPRNQ